jgi:hypothetical protein
MVTDSSPLRTTLAALAVLLVLLAGMAGGAPEPPVTSASPVDGAGATDPRADALVEEYNTLLDRAPALIEERFADDPDRRALALATYDLARQQVADRVVELHVTTDDGEELVYTVVTDDEARIVGYEEGPSDHETLRVETDETTLRAIAADEDPVSAALEAHERGDVVVSTDRTVHLATDGVDVVCELVDVGAPC